MNPVLLVGLGNPGAAYQGTRHNAGFLWIETLAQQWGVSWRWDKTYQGEWAKTDYQGQSIWLLKPMTFMNRSGQSVAALARFFKIQPEQIWVAHDELDLSPGTVRLKKGGGHAGHNGLRDIQAQLGQASFGRIRLGIGHPGRQGAVADYVLSKPSVDDHIAITQAIDHSLKGLKAMLQGDLVAAQGIVHRLP